MILFLWSLVSFGVIGTLTPVTTLLRFAFHIELNKAEVAISLMDSKNKICLCSFLSYKPWSYFFSCCFSELNQGTSEKVKCGESDQHADPGFVLYSPGDGPCEFCRCLIVEQNTWWSRLVPWLQQWVCRPGRCEIVGLARLLTLLCEYLK